MQLREWLRRPDPIRRMRRLYRRANAQLATVFQRGREDAVTIEYNDAGVLRTIYTLPSTTSDLPSVFAFSLPKAGSVLLDEIMRDLSAVLGLTYVSIMGEFFNLGLRASRFPKSTSCIFLDRGYCYGGFRSLPPQFEIPILSRARSILLVRDPRDMLVSHYFSTRSSHSNPGSKGKLRTSMKELPLRSRALRLPIDEYVLEFAHFYDRHMGRYMEAISAKRGNFRLFRYEDIIFSKREWVADICETFCWSLPQATISKIADRYDTIPRSEDETRHIRQVAPGDYKRKLKPETIARLTELFQRELAFFGYPE